MADAVATPRPGLAQGAGEVQEIAFGETAGGFHVQTPGRVGVARV